MKNKNNIKLALIAHDGKKADMVAFVMKRLDFFNRADVDIVATYKPSSFSFSAVGKPLESQPRSR